MTADETPIEVWVERAKGGDKAALEAVVLDIQDRVYNLALRMLWMPADAEDATQEILIKVVTHLSQFAGRSAFMTWVYRVATNHLLTTRARHAELAMRQEDTTADAFIPALPAPNHGELPEPHLLLTEMQNHCTLGMLLCLDRELRVAFILGVGFNVSGEEGAAITGTTPAAFRKRLSRARERLRAIMDGKCNFVNPEVSCSCTRLIGFAEQVTELFGDVRTVPLDLRAPLAPHHAEMVELDRITALFRSHPTYAAPDAFVTAVRALLASDRFALLS